MGVSQKQGFPGKIPRHPDESLRRKLPLAVFCIPGESHCRSLEGWRTHGSWGPRPVLLAAELKGVDGPIWLVADRPRVLAPHRVSVPQGLGFRPETPPIRPMALESTGKNQGLKATETRAMLEQDSLTFCPCIHDVGCFVKPWVSVS